MAKTLNEVYLRKPDGTQILVNTVILDPNGSLKNTGINSVTTKNNESAEGNANNLITGTNNKVGASVSNSFIFGSGNEDNGGKGAIIGGSNNKNTASRAFIVGDNNENSGTNSGVIGTKNKNSGNNSFVSGEENENTNKNSLIGGLQNKNKGYNSFVFGENNENINNNSVLLGTGLKSVNDNSVVFGSYNRAIQKESGKSVAFVVGAGANNDARKNAIEVYEDGTTYLIVADGTLDLPVGKTEFDDYVDEHDNIKNGEGNRSVIIGVAEKANNKGENSLLVGSNTIEGGENSAIFGTSNKVNITCGIVSGVNNTVGGNYISVFGESNNVDSIGKNVFIVGKENAFGTNASVSGEFCFICGYKNTVNGNNTFTFGLENKNNGNNSFLSGQKNQNSGENNILIGNDNNNEDKNNVILIGENLKPSNSNTIVAGTFNKLGDYVFAIGNGNAEEDRNNALEVYSSGVKVFATPESNNSVVRKKELDELNEEVDKIKNYIRSTIVMKDIPMERTLSRVTANGEPVLNESFAMVRALYGTNANLNGTIKVAKISKLISTGKNLIKLDFEDREYTDGEGNVIFSIKKDNNGNVVVKGTVPIDNDGNDDERDDGQYWIALSSYVYLEVGKKYILTGFPNNFKFEGEDEVNTIDANYKKLKLDILNKKTYNSEGEESKVTQYCNDTGSGGETEDIDPYVRCMLYLCLPEGETIPEEGLTIEPMLRLKGTNGSFEKYEESVIDFSSSPIELNRFEKIENGFIIKNNGEKIPLETSLSYKVWEHGSETIVLQYDYEESDEDRSPSEFYKNETVFNAWYYVAYGGE